MTVVDGSCVTHSVCFLPVRRRTEGVVTLVPCCIGDLDHNVWLIQAQVITITAADNGVGGELHSSAGGRMGGDAGMPVLWLPQLALRGVDP